MLADSDPRTVAPELFDALHSFEQRQVLKRHQLRLIMIGKGAVQYPDSEGVTSIARRAFLQGIFYAYFPLAVVLGVLACLALSFRAETAGRPALILAVFAPTILTAAVIGVWTVRHRQVRREFARMGDPGGIWLSRDDKLAALSEPDRSPAVSRRPMSWVGVLLLMLTRGILIWFVVPAASLVWIFLALRLRRRGVSFGQYLGWVDLNLVAFLRHSIFRPIIQQSIPYVPRADMASVEHRVRITSAV